MTHIYKYLPAERDTYFKDALLRFSPPSELNDPYECLPVLSKEVENLEINSMKKKLKEAP